MALSTSALIFVCAVLSAVGITLLKASGLSIDALSTGVLSASQISMAASGFIMYLSSFAIWLHIASISQIAKTFPLALVSSLVFVFLFAVVLFQQPFTLSHFVALGFIGIGIYLLGK